MQQARQPLFSAESVVSFIITRGIIFLLLLLLLDVLDAMPKHSRERLVGTVLRSSSTSCVAPSCVIVMIPCIFTYPQSFSLLFFFFGFLHYLGTKMPFSHL